MKYEEEQVEEFDGDCDLDKLISIILIFKMPLLITGKHVILELNEEELYLKNGRLYEIFLRMPVKVNEKKGKAEFDNEKKELKVEIEVKKTLKEALEKAANNDKLEIVHKKENKKIEMKTNLLYDLV